MPMYGFVCHDLPTGLSDLPHQKRWHISHPLLLPRPFSLGMLAGVKRLSTNVCKKIKKGTTCS